MSIIWLLAVCGVLPLVSGQWAAIPVLSKENEKSFAPKPCGDYPWNTRTENLTVSCNYYDYDGRISMYGRCTVNCLVEADMLVGPPYNVDNWPSDGAYHCRSDNRTWLGTEPVCLGHYDNATNIVSASNTIRLVGGEFYGCVELYDDVTQQWGPVTGWGAFSEHNGHENRMHLSNLVCRNLGFNAVLATAAYKINTNEHEYSDKRWTYETLSSNYRPVHDYNIPKFILSRSLPQSEGATLHDAIDRVERSCPHWDRNCQMFNMSLCLACTGKQDIDIEVTCTSDHLEVSFPRLPDNSVDATNVQLAAPPCKAEQNSTHIYIRAPLEECGTFREATTAEMIYRNTLIIGADPSHGGITWQELTKVPVECRLPRNKTLSLDFRPHLMSVFRSGIQGRGDFRISMELFRTDSFQQPITEYPVFVELREPIHVQIQVNSSDSDLQVFAHTCVATPSDNPDDKIQNDVIVDGCAKLPTLQIYPSPGPDRQRFGFQAFAYTSGVDMVYLHCKVLLCNATDPNSRCAQGCQSVSGRRRRAAEGEPDVYRLIQGPIDVGDAKDRANFQAHGMTSGHLDLVTASAILGVCVVVAAALFAVAIVYRTRQKGSQIGYRVLDNLD